jgi:transcriptional regulator with XRE-family HTH domain
MTLLERVRTDRGLSQLAVETASGVNHKTLVKYEKGRGGKFQTETLHKLAVFYEIPASTLLVDLREFHARNFGGLQDAA